MGRLSHGKVFTKRPCEGFILKYSGQRGASPLGCAEVCRVGGFVAEGFLKTWDQQPRVSFVSPSGRVDTVVF